MTWTPASALVRDFVHGSVSDDGFVLCDVDAQWYDPGRGVSARELALVLWTQVARLGRLRWTLQGNARPRLVVCRKLKVTCQPVT